MATITISHRATGSLAPSATNARTHSRTQIRQIADSIAAFGFNNPILIDLNGQIIAGHGRVEAAKLLGIAEVPTVVLEHLSDEQKRAYVLADNRLAELAGWDYDILAIELQNLLDADLGFEITTVGFETAEIDLFLNPRKSQNTPDPADELTTTRAGPTISQPGDLWKIGPHRLLCGNALLPESYTTLMGGERARMVFTDPPYNVPIEGHVCRPGKNRYSDFQMASGEMSEAEFTRFLTSAFRNMASASWEGSIHFVCMDWRHLSELLRAGRIAYSELKNICVWVKSNGGMGSLYRSQHELVAVFKSGEASHINNVQLGRHGRNRTNVWRYTGMSGFQSDREEKLAMHPTVKPVALVADAIMDCSRRKDVVLDPFAGSGTTILAAQRVGRRCFAMELDPAYVDVALRRMRSVLQIDPVRAATGEKFGAFEELDQLNDPSLTAGCMAAGTG